METINKIAGENSPSRYESLASGEGFISSDRDSVPKMLPLQPYRVFARTRMNFIARFLVFLGLIGTCSFCDAADIPCAARAMDRAKQLLTFHSGPDDRMTIDKTVKQLPSMRNPEDRTQKFDVLEIWGYIYKGRYRMRFIYYNSPATSCLLMGEEILEYARP